MDGVGMPLARNDKARSDDRPPTAKLLERSDGRGEP
jgi:hypothetical protein